MKKQEELHKAQINELTEKRKRLFKKETSFDLFVKEAEELEVPIDGEVRKGSQIFLLSCMSCHGLTKLTHKNSEAPSLGLLYGRKAGSDSSFKNYSNAMVNANFNWTSRMLYLFMENPSKLIKGTNCGLVLNPIAS